MGKLAFLPDQPRAAPRPLFETLPKAARAAIAHGNIPGAINYAKWAETYNCSVDDVEAALKIAANGSRKLPEEIAVSSPPAIASEEIEE